MLWWENTRNMYIYIYLYIAHLALNSLADTVHCYLKTIPIWILQSLKAFKSNDILQAHCFASIQSYLFVSG